MCGRIAQTATYPELVTVFRLEAGTTDILPNYNLSPSQSILAIRLDDKGRRSLDNLKWGFVPSWSTKLSSVRPINARAETIASKPMFRSVYKRNRCLIPASYFFEWQAQPDGKQPYAFRPESGVLFALAGIWDRWEKDGEILETAAIVVTKANDLMGGIHDRMPVIVPAKQYANWLARAPLDDAIAQQLFFNETPPEGWEHYQVSRALNSPKNNAPALLTRI